VRKGSSSLIAVISGFGELWSCVPGRSYSAQVPRLRLPGAAGHHVQASHQAT
jgi:hypothetical protein